MPIFNNILAGSSGQTTGYDIDQSLRLDDGDSAYLSRTPGSASNQKTWTWSCWVKRGNMGSFHPFFEAYSAGANKCYIAFDSNDNLKFQNTTSSSDNLNLISTQVFRDPSAWYHIVIALDTTQSTSSNRAKVYVNGEQVTSFGTETYPAEDADLNINSTYAHKVGEYTGDGAHYDGYLAELHFIDGQALTPASFGETNSATNQWVPTKYAGSYGTNGFYLKFQDSSALGDDSSGNTNDFTATNLVATDQVIDSPTNNFATLNPVSKGDAITLSEGNLKFADTSYDFCHATIQGMDKVYFEVCQLTNRMAIGVVEPTQPFDGSTFATNAWIIYSKADTNTIEIWNNNSESHEYTGLTLNTNGVLSFKIDFTTGNIYAWDTSGTAVNSGNSLKTFGTAVDWQLTTNNYGDAQSGIFNFGQDSSFAGTVTAQNNQDENDIGDFYRAVPSNYLAMCTDNLPDPAIALPTAHFDTTLYTGDGNSTQSISTNGSFDPEFAWVKIRSGSWGADNHVLYDIVRGNGKRLQSNSTGAEADLTSYGNQVAFATGGITVGSTNSGYNGQVNENSNLYVNWNWKAGGTASSNGDGSKTSSVSANPTAGFSIVTYTGDGTGPDTVGHGLSSAPELIIVKNRSSVYDWKIYNETIGNTKYLSLNTTDAEATAATNWNDTSPTASVFTVNTNAAVNQDTSLFVAYCFHSVEGYSKVGGYTGNGNADGSFVYTGFRPAFVMIKRYDSSSGANWILLDSKRDTFNIAEDSIYANLSNAEEDVGRLDFVSNGFKLRQNGTTVNTSSGTYIYLAFAESPFKTSNAR